VPGTKSLDLAYGRTIQRAGFSTLGSWSLIPRRVVR
jgi:hypothetical protein